MILEITDAYIALTMHQAWFQMHYFIILFSLRGSPMRLVIAVSGKER